MSHDIANVAKAKISAIRFFAGGGGLQPSKLRCLLFDLNRHVAYLH